MDNIKTADGLEKAIAEICRQQGIERGELLQKMDQALAILMTYAEHA
jgi:hypothetical protein